MYGGIMHKITMLAVSRQKPLIILENPKRQIDITASRYMASIGNACITFNGYFEDDLIELYADLKSKLEAGYAEDTQSQHNDTPDPS